MAALVYLAVSFYDHLCGAASRIFSLTFNFLLLLLGIVAFSLFTFNIHGLRGPSFIMTLWEKTRGVSTVGLSDAADQTGIKKTESEHRNHSLFAIADLVHTSYKYSHGSESRDILRERVCVMRVSWHGGVARREGVHIINSKQWDRLRKRRELIVLG
jgi:hypothetical protein